MRIMLQNEAFVATLLAGRFAVAALIRLPPQPIERDADEDRDAQPEQIVTEVRVTTEDYAVAWTPEFTHDPQPSFTFDPLPSYTYDPLPSYTYDPPAKYTDEGNASIRLSKSLM